MSEIHLFVDRVESGIATLLAASPWDGEVKVRSDMLPTGAREGTWLCASLAVDAHKREETARDIDALMNELGDSP
ncbi:MAG: DUF3006 domain-containing protein [Synergistaceae bacterium]|jgi:hypothetical protein|nr:DUF3006 domain-containing protein [Synergistaceae bacterium]